MDDTTARQLQSRAIPIELINLVEPNETRQFEKGRFGLYRVGPRHERAA